MKLTFEEGLRIFREQVPMGERTYRTFHWGKTLQIWLVEGRDFRSPNNMPDGPQKTIWGAEQKQWLQRTLVESDADWKILVSPTPIVGPDRDNKHDNHSNPDFAHEGREFREWVKANVADSFFNINGDRHWQYHSVHPETGLHEFRPGGGAIRTPAAHRARTSATIAFIESRVDSCRSRRCAPEARAKYIFDCATSTGRSFTNSRNRAGFDACDDNQNRFHLG